MISRLQDSLAVRDSIIEKLKTAIVDSIVPKINEIISYVNHYHTSHVVTDGVTNNGGTSGNSGSGSTSSDSFICGNSLVTDAQGNTYHTVELKRGLFYTCWMAENLRTQIEGDYGYPIGCVTAEDSLKAGRLYSHTIAVGETPALNGSGVRGICPEGWHLPSNLDSSYAQNLNAFPAGQYIGPNLGISSSYSDYGTKAYFWTSTLVLGDNSIGYACEVSTETTNKTLSKANGLSVRCLKDVYIHEDDLQIHYDSPIKPRLPGVGPIAF